MGMGVLSWPFQRCMFQLVLSIICSTIVGMGSWFSKSESCWSACISAAVFLMAVLLMTPPVSCQERPWRVMRVWILHTPLGIARRVPSSNRAEIDSIGERDDSLKGGLEWHRKILLRRCSIGHYMIYNSLFNFLVKVLDTAKLAFMTFLLPPLTLEYL